MKDIILMLVVLCAFVYGYIVMIKVDKFMKECRRNRRNAGR